MVGQVVEIVKHATNVVYVLDDGTGRVEARHWIVSSSNLEDEPDDKSGDIE